jgi:hypothetical protein
MDVTIASAPLFVMSFVVLIKTTLLIGKEVDIGRQKTLRGVAQSAMMDWQRVAISRDFDTITSRWHAISSCSPHIIRLSINFDV